MPAIQITGLRETIHALNKIKRNMPAFLVHATDKYTEQIKNVAKESCPVDTGALQASIHNKKAVREGVSVKGQVIAGSDAISRGQGKYKVSRKTNKPVSLLATSQYAEVAEERSLNRKGFMRTAVNWADAKAKRAVRVAIETAIRTF